MGMIGGFLFLVPLILVYMSGYENGQLLQSVNAKIQSDEQNVTLIDEEVLIGVLARAIPYTYEDEALKAQAVVSRTYMARRALGIQIKGQLPRYSLDEMKSLWQGNFDNIYETYKKAVEETRDEVIFYNGQPIEALYSVSSGEYTRDAIDVYGKEVPYLKSVESEGDPITKQVKLQKKEVVDLLKVDYPEAILEVDTLESQIQVIEKDSAEYIKSIQIGNLILTGEEVRKILELPSSNFRIFVDGEYLIFDVKGSGQGVGMSQNGANEMAKQDMGYKEILNHYYQDVTIEKYSDQQ